MIGIAFTVQTEIEGINQIDTIKEETIGKEDLDLPEEMIHMTEEKDTEAQDHTQEKIRMTEGEKIVMNAKRDIEDQGNIVGTGLIVVRILMIPMTGIGTQEEENTVTPEIRVLIILQGETEIAGKKEENHQTIEEIVVIATEITGIIEEKTEAMQEIIRTIEGIVSKETTEVLEDREETESFMKIMKEAMIEAMIEVDRNTKAKIIKKCGSTNSGKTKKETQQISLNTISHTTKTEDWISLEKEECKETMASTHLHSTTETMKILVRSRGDTG